ncbi:MAG: helix-turn-helix transcriptional regulator [Oscillospiraceae bacterium]|nr:helix-turn-helix transcriptional regulator [Oscillospiraceae bacterium]MBP1590584.1 helix-turn-helix transcriptional regulator [Oscillospiraceae bacterium]
MKIRNELNAELFRQKMYNFKRSEPSAKQVEFTSVCNGDIESVKKQLSLGELALTDDRIMSKNKLQNALYNFVLSASAIASACMNTGMGQTEACTLSDLYVLKTDNCNTIECVHKLYEDMCLDFTERMQEIRKEAVISLHIRKCIDHIYENLGADLSVKALAKVTELNPAYLSRLFRQETGVPLKRFVKEARVDTAQNLLRYSELPYSVISTSLGFSTQSVFIAVFKEITGMTPKVYREKYYRNNR